MKKKKIKWMWIIIPLVVVGAVGEFLFFFGDKIFTAPLPEGFVFTSGRLDTRVIDASSKVGGRLVDINVKEGDRLTKGQLIATISPSELNAQLKSAEANIELLESRKAQARVDLELTRDQVNSGIRQAKAHVNVAEANLARSRACFKQTEVDFSRAEQLYTTGAIPKRKFEAQRLARDIADKEVKVAEKALEEANIALELAQDMKKTLQAKEIALKSLEQMSAAAAADKELIQVHKEEMTICSPCEGTVLDRVMDPGEVVSPGIPVVTIVSPKELYLKVYLKTADMSRVRIGNDVRLALDGLKETIDAKVIRISDQAEFTPKNVETKDQRTNLVFEVRIAQFDDPQGILKAGMSGEVIIRTDNSKNWDLATS